MKVLLFTFLSLLDQQETEEVLAKSVIAEVGWSSPDHKSMMHVLARRAKTRGIPIKRMTKQYCSLWKVNTRRSKMIRGLNRNGDKPPHWNNKLSWKVHRRHWFRTLALARAFLSGKYIRDPCKGRPNHFGDRKGDLTRALKNNWEFIDCGRHNYFWRE